MTKLQSRLRRPPELVGWGATMAKYIELDGRRLKCRQKRAHLAAPRPLPPSGVTKSSRSISPGLVFVGMGFLPNETDPAGLAPF